MDRRNFIKTLLASGVLGSTPLASQAASELFTSGRTQPVMIVGQSGLPHAAELVARLTQVLAAAGIDYATTEATASELAEYSRVAALLDAMLDDAPATRVIGIMDDASALIFQELAAARGAACALSTHHRFTGQEVRHCCTSARLEGNIAWSDSLADHAGRISRIYAGTIGGRRPTGGHGEWVATEAADARPGSLVSFLITV